MTKLYIVKWRTAKDSGTRVLSTHLPRPGMFCMMEEVLVTEVEATGKHWLYDPKTRKLIAQPSPLSKPTLKLLPAPARKRTKGA